ncbi:MAG: DUF1501 domain-containing protein [Kordiimonadaceae bacterium]|nr:DUF1501 domain-containing protein [Kordiimonadaceae bacterium]MBO6568721.1 DUF1501 domain-containing protein [Kordiimonadaceae bacterium]MBO6965303.1 DUF1501 domain-containing protein [Kordiimonadaceae bacterium]
MTFTRRKFLRTVGASALVGSTCGLTPSMFSAQAASISGYKAMVCLFLYGGLDSHDMLIPYDQDSYNSYSTVRQSMINQYAGGSRSRSNLLALQTGSASNLGGMQMALPPEMAGVKTLFDSGDAAFVSNVGPLIEPVTKSSFENGAALPPRLFSHNDQQATWQASAPEGAQEGWGGLFADAILDAGGNSGAETFTNITVAESGPFLIGRQAFPYQIGFRGPASVDALEELGSNDISAEEADFFNRLKQSFIAQNFNSGHVLELDMANALRGAFDANDKFASAASNAQTVTTPFGGDPVSSQLKAVADTIALRDVLGTNRQIFFIALGGFDTHDAQAATLPARLKMINDGVSSFSNAMKELGLNDSVTLFTATDFGRTLAVNGDGTDHGWGGHQMVVGGAVKGREIYGTMPEAKLNHDQDSGGGRLIPTLSVEQYAAPLGSWFGLGPSELTTALPRLGNFDAGPGFI